MPQDRMTVGCRIADTDGQNRRRIGLAYGVFATALAALLCAQAGAARAGDDTAAQESLTDKFWKTLGLKNPGETEYEINYSERSPLVVPPNRNLPPPTSGAAPVANWPKDPDLARRKASKDDDKPVIRNYDSVIESGRALTPEELNRVSRDPKHVAAPGTPEQSTPDTGPLRRISPMGSCLSTRPTSRSRWRSAPIRCASTWIGESVFSFECAATSLALATNRNIGFSIGVDTSAPKMSVLVLRTVKAEGGCESRAGLRPVRS